MFFLLLHTKGRMKTFRNEAGVEDLSPLVHLAVVPFHTITFWNNRMNYVNIKLHNNCSIETVSRYAPVI